METVELEHEWTKERQTVRVERVTVKLLFVRFPVIGSGIYELNLTENKMRSTSPAIRRKHPFCLWRAADIEGIRRFVWVHLNPKHEEVKKSYERHTETMQQTKRAT